MTQPFPDIAAPTPHPCSSLSSAPRFQITFLFALIISWSSAAAGTFVYVSVDGEKRIAVYKMSEATGELKLINSVKLKATPGPLCASPDRRFVFASLRSDGQLASFQVDSQSGNLRPISVVRGGADPAYVSTDRSGRYLLTAYYVAAKVTVHSIDDKGRLSATPLQTIPTAEKAHAILTDPGNRYVFVPHTGPNAIYQFRFDEKSGKLTPNKPPFLSTGDQTGPRQLAFHPKLNVVFFDYEQGSAIASFDLNRATGRLSFRERLSSLPRSYSKENSNARIEATPDGRFVYVANRGHDSLAGYAVDALSGNLRSLGNTPTETTPRGFGIDPAGRFLYAAGQNSGKLAAYHINYKTGALTRFATYNIGNRPWWVMVMSTSK